MLSSIEHLNNLVNAVVWGPPLIYGTKSLRSDHLYQLLAYLRNCEATTKSEPKLEGILLYPVIDEPLAADVRLEGFPIRVRGINLAQDWPRIHTDMLAVIAAV